MKEVKLLPKIEVVLKNNHLKIYIDGLAHLSISLEQISGYKAKVVSKHYYHIEFFTTDNIIDCDYKEKIVWEEILKQLDTITAL